MNIVRGEPLAKHTTVGVGGAAEFFVKVHSTDELKEALFFAEKKSMPVTLLGSGSNVLVADEGIRGLTIVNAAKQVMMKKNICSAESGATWPEICKTALGKSYGGLSAFAGLPGTVGGAAFGNAGCYGTEIADVVEKIYARKRGKQPVWLTGKECQFGYRHSLFKKEKTWCVLQVNMRLTKVQIEEEKERMQDTVKKRNAKEPRERKAGSFFVNPKGIHAWQLIDAAHLRGAKVGGAMVSHEHANYLVNTGGATADDFVQLILKITDTVKKTQGVALETEVQRLGF